MGVALREKITATPDYTEKSRFGFPKFDAKSWTRFLKKPKKDKARIMDLSDLPQLRMIGGGVDADHEADAPARVSIFAEDGFAEVEEVAAAPLSGNDLSFDEAATEEAIPAASLSEPVDMPVEEPLIEELPVAQAEPEVAAAVTAPADDLADLTIAQLADRLEAGLNRLKHLEAGTGAAIKVPAAPVNVALINDAPVNEAPAPSPPPSENVTENVTAERAPSRHADMDAALKAALGTLEKMATQR